MKRNAPCPCGSGRKFKHCCLGREAREAAAWQRRSNEDVEFMAKALEISPEALRARFKEAQDRGKARRFKRSTAAAATFAALYGGMGL